MKLPRSPWSWFLIVPFVFGIVGTGVTLQGCLVGKVGRSDSAIGPAPACDGYGRYGGYGYDAYGASPTLCDER
jgi:hypothetical protein